MKKIFSILIILMFFSMIGNAQNPSQARKILDKTASVISYKGGASANFKISSNKFGSHSGSITIKGNKFHATNDMAIVWYNGKTQWTLMKSTNEVNVSNPNEAKQMSMNPYKFLTMYKKGYNLSMTTDSQHYNVHLLAQNPGRSVQEIYILINKTSSIPTKVKMRQGKTWTTIDISNFKSENVSDATFNFNSKDYPKAEVIDLR